MANERAIDVQLSTPNHTSLVKDVEQQITFARSLIWEGVRKEELDMVRPWMQKRLAGGITKRDEGV
jgi:hypothetical protein